MYVHLYLIGGLEEEWNKKVSKHTLETSESGLALRTDLIFFSAFVLVASSAYGKRTLITGHERVSSIHRETNIISTYMAFLST